MIIGIRREDKNQWEGRVPLIPSDIAELKNQHNINFAVQPSKIRAFQNEEFIQAGAEVREDISDCSLVIAVKEIPVDFFLSNKKYMFFSHTIKGQKENLPILKRILEKKATLIDYEKIVDNNNKRLVFFGKYAGIAGMIDSFHGYGKKLKSEGVFTPFEKIKYSTDYKDLNEAKQLFLEVGEEIRQGKLTFPVIIGITGYGNVSRGAQEIIDLLPVEEISPEKLLTIEKNTLSLDRVYKVIFKEKDIVTPIKGDFELNDYYQHPGNYISSFSRYLSKLNLLINGIYWDNRYPKLLTCDFVKNNYDLISDLKIIGDISCDVNGGIECTQKNTNSGNPFFVYNPDTGKIQDGLDGRGPAVLAVDNLPGEIARDSSTFFSNILKKFIPHLKNGNMEQDFDNIQVPAELKKAVIIFNGQFTPDFKYLEQYL